MKIFATTATAVAAVLAVASAAESGLRDLQTNPTDCSEILDFKIYVPGQCGVAPVRTVGAPGYIIQRLHEGNCLSPSKVDSYNIMMATKNPTAACGSTQPACARFKLYCTSEGKTVRRQVEYSTLRTTCFAGHPNVLNRRTYSLGRLLSFAPPTPAWPYFLFGDTPCNPNGTISSSCNPTAFINDSTGPLPVGTYYIMAETFSSCTPGSPPTGLLDAKNVSFSVSASPRCA
jgi:hypothetical protein